MERGFMERDENKLQEQEAPLKNTDNAFVQVNKDGSPLMPSSNEEKKEETKREENLTTLDNR